MSDRTVYWIGTEDDQHRERIKACRARCKLYGRSSCEDKDGSCDECEEDMAHALRVTKERFDAHAKEYGDV
ncbi:MAG TPA: hypothetical protein VIU82_00315 [Bosea sp. (in: a-proteobacteria)]